MTNTNKPSDLVPESDNTQNNTGTYVEETSQDAILKEIAEANEKMALSANVTDPGQFRTK